MLRLREAFEACVAHLRAQSQIAVTHCWLGPPATDEEIAEVEAAVGPLPGDVRALYKQCNGVQLRWIDRESPEFDADDEKPLVTTYDWLVEGNEPSADGVIHFVPVHRLDDPGSMYTDEDDGVRVFDAFGASSGMVALVREDGPNGKGPLTTRLSLGSDSNACWDRCSMTFGAYVEAVLGCYGHIRRRIDLLLGLAKPGWTIPLRPPLPRGPAADKVRVQWSDPTYGYAVLRGTLLSSEGDQLHIAADLRIPGFSERVVVRERRQTDLLATPGDTYELARSAPGAFLRALTEVSPAAARGMFASVRGDIRQLHRDPRFPTTFSPSVFVVLALFAELEGATVLAAFAALLRQWMLVPVTEHAAYGPVDDLAEAITALLVTTPVTPTAELRRLVDEAELFAKKRPGASNELRPLIAHVDYWRGRLRAD
ncbi:MAG: SMI1/KNR4 family protein [Polyangiaceae bacterium]|nr:SMI1/KNR4 family protein [Polyangiaceae bacterium]